MTIFGWEWVSHESVGKRNCWIMFKRFENHPPKDTLNPTYNAPISHRFSVMSSQTLSNIPRSFSVSSLFNIKISESFPCYHFHPSIAFLNHLTILGWIPTGLGPWPGIFRIPPLEHNKWNLESICLSHLVMLNLDSPFPYCILSTFCYF